jgi:hypothetical protein
VEVFFYLYIPDELPFPNTPVFPFRRSQKAIRTEKTPKNRVVKRMWLSIGKKQILVESSLPCFSANYTFTSVF